MTRREQEGDGNRKMEQKQRTHDMDLIRCNLPGYLATWQSWRKTSRRRVFASVIAAPLQLATSPPRDVVVVQVW